MKEGREAPVILARGEDYLVASKPVGLATTGRTLEDPNCLHYQLMEALNRRKVWAVHQLDKGTSGACLFALKKPAVSVWAERLRAGRKLYLGICDGQLLGTHQVHAPIGRITRDDGRTQAAIVPSGKPAHSTIWALENQGERTLFAAQIHSGRTHQVRLHLSHLGFPLVGEGLHRSPPCERLPHPALHAWCLALDAGGPHPLKIIAPLPRSLEETLASMGFSAPDAAVVGF